VVLESQVLVWMNEKFGGPKKLVKTLYSLSKIGKLSAKELNWHNSIEMASEPSRKERNEMIYWLRGE